MGESLCTLADEQMVGIECTDVDERLSLFRILFEGDRTLVEVTGLSSVQAVEGEKRRFDTSSRLKFGDSDSSDFTNSDRFPLAFSVSRTILDGEDGGSEN